MRALQQRWPGIAAVFGGLILLLIAIAVADGVRQSHTKAVRNPNDFVTLYAGSICMTHACNPYSVSQLDSVLVARRGTEVRQDWADQLPIYPPTTLFLLLPFSLLSYKAATMLWFAVSFAVYIFGLCWTSFRSSLLEGTSVLARSVFVLAALHFPKMLQCLGFGNPSVMVTGLLLFAVFDRGERRRGVRLAAALLACFLKPPMAIPVAVVMLLRDSRSPRGAAKVAALSVALFAMIALLSYGPSGMRDWRHDLAANLSLGEEGGMNPSNRVSPSNVLLNVANIPGYFTHDGAVIQMLALGIVTAVTVPFMVALWRVERTRQWSDRVYVTAVAAAAALTLLPVYHRFCDIGVLLLLVPWMLREFAGSPRWQAWFALPMVAALYVSWERRIHLERLSGGTRALVEFVYYRGDAVIVLLLACTLVWALLQAVRVETVRDAALESR